MFCHWSEPFLEHPAHHKQYDAWMPWIGFSFKECINLAIRSQELLMNIRVVTKCVSNQIRSCLLRPHESLHENTPLFTSRASAYCGWLALRSDSTRQHIPLTKNIRVVDHFKIHLSFIIKFDIPWTWRQDESCSSTGVRLTAPIIGYEERFCGKRLPWNLDIDSDRLEINVYGHPSAARYTDVTFVYELIHKDVIIHKDEIWPDQPLSPGVLVVMSLINGVTVDYMYTWHIVTYPISNLQLQFQTDGSGEEDLGDLTVYDGPGKRSPTIPVHLGFSRLSSKIISSSFHLTITFFLKNVPGLLEANYKSDSFLESSPTSHPIGCGKLPEYWHSPLISLWSPKKAMRNTVCFASLFAYWKEHEVTISSFKFSGPTSIYQYLPFQCQHGGLYVYNRDDSTGKPLMDFCNSFGKYPPEIIYAEAIAVVAVWFAGYTHGHLTISFKRADCTLYSRSCTNQFPGEESLLILGVRHTPECVQVSLSLKDVVQTNDDKEQSCRFRLVMEREESEDPSEIVFLSYRLTTFTLGPLRVSSIAVVKDSENVYDEMQTVQLFANSSAGERLESPLYSGGIVDWSNHRPIFLDIAVVNTDWQPPFMVTLNIDLISSMEYTYQLPPGDVTLLVDTERLVMLQLDYSSGTKNITVDVPENHKAMATISYIDCPVRCRNDSIIFTEDYRNYTNKISFSWKGKHIDGNIDWSATGPHSRLEVLIHRKPRCEYRSIHHTHNFCFIKLVFIAVPWTVIEPDRKNGDYVFYPPE